MSAKPCPLVLRALEGHYERLPDQWSHEAHDDALRALEDENARLKTHHHHAFGDGCSACLARAEKVEKERDQQERFKFEANIRAEKAESLLRRVLAVHGCAAGSPHFPACAEALAALKEPRD